LKLHFKLEGDLTMKRTLTVAALLAFAVAPAMADDQDITLSAAVDSFCTVGTVDIDSFALTVTGGDVDTAASVHEIPVTCNGSSTVVLESQTGGLNGPGEVSGFEHIINYTAAASGYVTIPAGSTATVPTVGAAEPLGSEGGTASATPLTVTITPVGNTDPILAGSYGDVLRVSINAI
jgi:hypothetical protein